MIFRFPEYYMKFRCTAGECRDSCCIGWEIDIDKETDRYYSSVEGEFGKRLRENISDSSFILRNDERCPFLNSSGLCDIYTELSKEHLCQICSDHPRFFEWFGDVKEGGLGLCCEAAADLILSHDLVLVEEEIEEEPVECSNELYDLLLSAREVMICQLSSGVLYNSLCTALDYAEKLQQNMDNGEYVLPEWRECSETAYADPADVIGFYTTLEQITPEWAPELIASLEKSPEPLTKEQEKMLRRIAVYFIYRYFLKGVFDGEIVSRVKLASVSAYIIARLFRRSGDCLLTAKNYSKETEYCEENIEALCDAFYEKSYFSTSCIKGLLHQEIDFEDLS